MKIAKILIVEDEPIIAINIKNLLEMNGYLVCEIAPTAAGAVELASRENPDLILMDILLSGENDGIFAAKEIKKKQDIPIIFLTARYDEKNIDKARLSNPHGFMIKPVSENELVSSIEIILNRHAMEKRLKESEERYFMLFNRMIDGYSIHEIILDENGKPADYRFIDINPAFEKMTGISRSIIGKTVLEAMPDTDPHWIETYGKVALTGDSIHFENYSAPLSKWFQVVAYRPQNGMFACIFTDITERKAIEEEIELSNQVVSNMQIGLHIYKLENAADDSSLRMVFANNASAVMTGVPVEDIIGKTIDENFPGLREKGIPAIYAEVVRTGKPVVLEDVSYGDHRIIESVYSVKAFPLPKSRVGVSFENITDKRRTSEQLQVHQLKLEKELKINRAISDISDHLILHDLSIPELAKLVLKYGMILTGSSHGYVSEIDPDSRENIGHTLTEMMDSCILKGPDRKIVFPPQPDGKYPKLWGHALNTFTGFYTNSPGEHESAGGIPVKHVKIENFLTSPAIIGKELLGQVALANSSRDYTDEDLILVQKLADLYAVAINRTRNNNSIRQSLEEKVVLLKEIHHRVKNNMQVISSLIGLQASQIMDSEDRKLYRDTQSRIKTMALVHEKLYMSDNFSSINLKDYIQSLVLEITRLYEINQQKVKTEIKVTDLYIDINRAVPCALIINELLSNAYRHAFPEGSEGKIFLDLSKGEEGEFVLKVTDNGIGIPDGIDPFNTDSLGLVLIRSLTQQVNGRLTYDVKNGTAFTVTFPES